MIPLLSICLSIICKCNECVKSRLENTGHDLNSCALPCVFEMALNRAETVSPSHRLSIVCVRGWDRPHRSQDVCRSVAPPEVHHCRPSAPVALQWSRLLPRACTEPGPNQPAYRPSVANHHCQPLRIRPFSLRLVTGETYRRRVLEQSLVSRVSRASLDESLLPGDTGLFVKEELEQGKLASEKPWRVARAVDLGLRIALLFVISRDEPVEVRFGV